MAATSATVDHESMKEQIAALMRVLLVKKSFEEDSTPCEIDEGLYLGSVGSVRNKDALKNLNITHILTVAGKWAPTHRAKFVSKIIDVADRDDTNLKQYFDECFDFIDEAKRNGGCVLVHCYAGKSRSVTIVVAYLMKTRGMSLSEALQHVKNKRPQAAPNCGFIRQLEDFEKSLQDSMAPKRNMAALKALALEQIAPVVPNVGTSSGVAAEGTSAAIVTPAAPITVVNPEVEDEEEDRPLQRKRKQPSGQLPPRSKPQDREKTVIDLSDQSKRNKKHKSAAPFDPKAYMTLKTEEFQADPFGVSISVLSRMADLVREDKTAAALQIKDLEARYESARKAVSPLRADLEKSQKDVDLYKKMAEDSEVKRLQLEAEKKQLEAELKLSNEKFEKAAVELQEKDDKIAEMVATTSAQNFPELQEQIEKLTALNVKALEDRMKANQMGQEGIVEAFNNALDQVAVVNPDFIADRDIFNPEYGVHDGHIVEFDPESDEVSRIVYPKDV